MARILLVDDDAGIREMTALRLQIDGHHVITAESAEEALRVAAGSVRFDVAVLDLHLSWAGQSEGVHVGNGRSRDNGDAMLAMLRRDEATARLPIVFYTADARSTTAVHGLSLADAQLTRGQPLTRLLATISSLSAPVRQPS